MPIHIELDGVPYSSPDSWDELTLGRYCQIMDRFGSPELADNEAGQFIALTSGLFRIPEQTLKDYEAGLVVKLLGTVGWFNQAPAAWTQDFFVLEGRKYSLPKDIGQRSFGQFVDASTYRNMKRDHPWQALPDMLAIYLEGEGDDPKVYQADHFEERRTLFLQLPMSIAYGLPAFFLARLKLQSELTKIYSAAIQNVKNQLAQMLVENRKLTRSERKASRRSTNKTGAGTGSWRRWLTRIYLRSTAARLFPNAPLSKSSTSLVIRKTGTTSEST